MRIQSSIALLAALLAAPLSSAQGAEDPRSGAGTTEDAAGAPGKGGKPAAGAGEAKGDDPKAAAPAPGELPPLTAPRSDLPRVELHGGAFLWYYQPIPADTFKPQPENNIELYLASLEFTGRLDDFGLYLNPRFRDSKVREFFTSNVWVEEAYAFWEKEYVTAKAGKIYKRFSRFWDDTFYGSMPYFDGFKLDSNYGLSFEGIADTKTGFAIGYWGQYFVVDGGTNGSLRSRDTVWVSEKVTEDGKASSRTPSRNHSTVLRVEPSYTFDERTSLRVGIAGEYAYVDFKNIRPSHVFRFGTDVSFVYAPVRLFGEFITQVGQTVTDYPIEPVFAADGSLVTAGKASRHNHYALLGAEFQWWKLTARYSFSLVSYRDIPVTEVLHVPGVTLAVHDNVNLMLEYAFWKRSDPGDVSVVLDNSLNSVIYARF
jgi:hypothetical protein